MITEDNPDYYGYTIFCDDIRREIANKVSFIGVYQGKMLIGSSFPAIIPKFGINIVYLQKKRALIKMAKYIILLPGDDEGKPTVEIESEIPQKVIDSFSDEQHYIVNLAPVVLSPMTINQPGEIKVRAIRGDKLVRLGSLEVASASPQELVT